MTDQVKMTNDIQFIPGLSCNVSDVIFLIMSKTNGIDDHFFISTLLPDNRILNPERSTKTTLTSDKFLYTKLTLIFNTQCMNATDGFDNRRWQILFLQCN